jgi:release factor glutamine methyltransferase
VQTRIGDLLRVAARRLAELPQAEPRLEAELLLGEATGLRRTQLLAWPERSVPAEALSRFDALLARRLAGEPIAYIRGRQAFWTLELTVTRDTLVPRPETELLVETALELLPADAPLLVADAGTGSGAIAAALADERPAWTLIAIERQARTAAVAAENLHRCAPDNAHLLRADWLAPIAAGTLDAIVSNPPYIAEADPHLGRGDLVFEPRAALAAGPDGLTAIRRLADEAAECLRPGGWLLLEHGFDQGNAVRAILAERGLRRVATRPDLAGLPRVTCGIRRAGADIPL